MDRIDFGASVGFANLFRNVSLAFIMTSPLHLIGCIAAGAFATIYYDFMDTSPYSTAVSYKDWVYTHYNGYYVTPTRVVEEHSVYLWPLENYEQKTNNIYCYYRKYLG
ncbi:MAG: hypothetical protein VB018_11945 [Lachnospiraceae bacterium]|nr:hypothetical protein [Lachnospiraceae bacterium]